MRIEVVQFSRNKARVYLVYENGRRVKLDTITIGVISLSSVEATLTGQFHCDVTIMTHVPPEPRAKMWRERREANEEFAVKKPW